MPKSRQARADLTRRLALVLLFCGLGSACSDRERALEALWLRLARLPDAAERGDVARAQELVRDLREPRAP